MDYRPGTCSACKASFRIPSSFTANRAKCSKCGGVVEIGPVVGDAGSAPQQPAKAVSAPVAGAAARLAASREPAPAPSRPPPPRAPTPSVHHAPSAADHGHHPRRHKRQRESIPIGLKVTFAVVAPILAVAAYMTWKWFQDAEADRKVQEQHQQDVLALEKKRLENEKQLFENAKKLAAAEAAKPADAGAPGAADAGVAPKPPAPKPPPKPVEGFDLSTIPDFGPLEGTTDAQWKELQSLAAMWADYDAGAASMRAGEKLLETPKPAFPAILNQLKRQNLETDKGFAVALGFVKELERICPRHTIRWSANIEKDWVKRNQVAIKKWCDLWTKASTDAAYWEKLTKPLVHKDSLDEDPAAKPPVKGK